MTLLQEFHRKLRNTNKSNLPLKLRKRQQQINSIRNVRKMEISEISGNQRIAFDDFLEVVDVPASFMKALEERPYTKYKWLRMGTRENFLCDGTFHQAIGKIFLVAVFFGIMPLRGYTSTHPKQLKFSWRYKRTWYCLLLIVGFAIEMCFALIKIANGPITFNKIEPLIFRVSILIVCMCTLRLARKWPQLMLHWDEVERSLPQYQSQIEKQRMAHEIKMVTFVAMMLSLGEHLLSTISVIHYSNNCPLTKDPIKNYFLILNEHLFYIVPYSKILAFLGKFGNVLSTFIWNYMDVLVIIIAIGLSTKFKQINANLMKFKGMQMPESFWLEYRLQYRNLCILSERVDSAISFITMVSFSNNLYFICVQLLRSLNKMPSIAHTVYFYFSLLFLLGRTLAVSLYSACVNEESKRPLRILRCVPKESWCTEVKRFMDDISNEFVALSGMKFFHLTRQVILSVAGTIITYELVLIQFHEDSSVWDCENNVTRNNLKNKIKI